MPQLRGFASDNNASIHPKVLEEIGRANTGHARAYGDDAWTARVQGIFQQHFGPQAHAHLVFNGTGANVLGLSAVLKPWQAVICTELAHIHVDECGAPEKLSGSKLLSIPTDDGKLLVPRLKYHLHKLGDQHHVQPHVLSISQTTEMGTVYTPDELRALSEFAHGNGMLLHMDGARVANAAAALDVPLRTFTTDAGVDVLSFGGTKNGIMMGEAVVFLRSGLGEEFRFVRKQGMQLASKMRFVAAQFIALFDGDLWLQNARHANQMARRLDEAVRTIKGVKITQKVDANAIFARLPRESISALQKEYFFYIWDEDAGEVRWMCSFDTTKEDVDGFASAIRRVLGVNPPPNPP